MTRADNRGDGTAWTPGPWTVEVHELSEGPAVCVYGGNGMMLADYLDEPTANLIAAAPWLFDACEDALEAFKLLVAGMSHDRAVLDMIKPHIDELETALRKVTGGPA